MTIRTRGAKSSPTSSNVTGFLPILPSPRPVRVLIVRRDVLAALFAFYLPGSERRTSGGGQVFKSGDVIISFHPPAPPRQPCRSRWLLWFLRRSSSRRALRKTSEQLSLGSRGL